MFQGPALPELHCNHRSHTEGADRLSSTTRYIFQMKVTCTFVNEPTPARRSTDPPPACKQLPKRAPGFRFSESNHLEGQFGIPCRRGETRSLKLARDVEWERSSGAEMGFTKLRPQEAQPDITEPEAVVNLAVQTGNLQACSSGT